MGLIQAQIVSEDGENLKDSTISIYQGKSIIDTLYDTYPGKIYKVIPPLEVGTYSFLLSSIGYKSIEKVVKIINKESNEKPTDIDLIYLASSISVSTTNNLGTISNPIIAYQDQDINFSYNALSIDDTYFLPVYYYQADKSDVRGEIGFEVVDGGYGGYNVKGIIRNLPEGYTNTMSSGFTSTSNNYQELAKEMLNILNKELSELTDPNDVVGGFGKLILEGQNAYTNLLKYEILGEITDKEGNRISEALIKDDITIENVPQSKTQSQQDGSFILQGYYKKDTTFNINISAKEYSQLNITPFNGPPDNEIKNNLGIIVLTPLVQDLKQEIRNEILIEKDQLKKLKKQNLDFEIVKQQLINKAVINIKTSLIPSILRLITQFGIAKVSEIISLNPEEIEQTCPTNLNELIERKNKLTKALNNIYNFLNKTKIGIQILDGSIDAAQIVLETLKALTLIPSTAATPIPSSSALGVKAIQEKLKKYKLISSSTLIILTMLIQALSKALQYLSLLDTLIQKCATKDSIPQEQISNDLLLATQQQSNQLSPVVTNVNGFEMAVITVDNVTINGLKRRRAIAKNKSGVIMLQGEPSFSSNDQILIDELVFYIQQNDLKAD